jgi:hypothetical protein
VAAFAFDAFELQAEAFVRARVWREHAFATGLRPGRSLVSLYDEDFPDFTSIELWADLQSATPEDARQLRGLAALLASAELEGGARDLAVAVTRVESTTVMLEDRETPWREAPARWPLIPEVTRRHELEAAWRSIFRSELNSVLSRWQEALRAGLPRLGGDDWLTFWSDLHGLDLEAIRTMAQGVLNDTAETYGHGLAVYLGQLDLPVDDAWTSDVEWAFRAPRFDMPFTERARMPLLVRVFRDLGIELEEQSGLKLEYELPNGVAVFPLHIPSEVQVSVHLNGGWRDYARCLRALGIAQHALHTDPSLRVWERWLGDETPNLGYGFLFEGLLRNRTWLASRLDYIASDDFRVIANLEWLWRLRRTAALSLYEQRLWQSEPGTSTAVDFEESLSSATRIRHFGDEYLAILLESPWSTLRPSRTLRAEVFAAQVRAFLQREFDEEWWRSMRAARFIKDELWRPGRRHSADELLRFMGYAGFEPGVLVAEFQEVLQPL